MVWDINRLAASGNITTVVTVPVVFHSNGRSANAVIFSLSLVILLCYREKGQLEV